MVETTRFLRQRHLASILALTAVALLPFSLYHWWAGHERLLLITAGANAAIAALLFYLWLTHQLGLVSIGLQIAGGLGTLASAWTQGMPGATWAYPLILVTYLLFQPGTAVVANILFLAGLYPVAIAAIDPNLATRFLITVTMVSIFSCVFALAVDRGYRRADRLAQTDPLTGTWNRRLLPDHLDDALRRLANDDEPSSLVVLDVDHFKAINDRHGHARGDEILVRLGELLQTTVRDEDQVFRYGGEEFVIVLPEHQITAAQTLAERVRRTVEAFGEQTGLGTTVSLGIAELQPGESGDAWLERADQALLYAKQQGRNCCCSANATEPATGRAPKVS